MKQLQTKETLQRLKIVSDQTHHSRWHEWLSKDTNITSFLLRYRRNRKEVGALPHSTSRHQQRNHSQWTQSRVQDWRETRVCRRKTFKHSIFVSLDDFRAKVSTCALKKPDVFLTPPDVFFSEKSKNTLGVFTAGLGFTEKQVRITLKTKGTE
jgi:hypothetical protein